MYILIITRSVSKTLLFDVTVTLLLENVEHCGGEPEQADTACLLANRNAWVPGGGLYVLCVVCPLVLGCQGKACLSTCCLSHGEPLGGGMSVDSLGTRPSLAEEEEEGLVNFHTYKFEVRGISAE